MKPVGEWSIGSSYGAVVSTASEDSAYPGGADDDTIRAYGGHLVAESICPEHRHTIAALPRLLKAALALLDEDEGTTPLWRELRAACEQMTRRPADSLQQRLESEVLP